MTELDAREWLRRERHSIADVLEDGSAMQDALTSVLDVCDAWEKRADSLAQQATAALTDGMELAHDALNEAAADFRCHANVIRDAIAPHIGKSQRKDT